MHQRTGSGVSVASSLDSDATGRNLSMNGQKGAGGGGLRRAPSAVSFRAPLLRASIAGQGGLGGGAKE